MKIHTVQPWERAALLPHLRNLAPGIAVSIEHEDDPDAFIDWNDEWGDPDDFQGYMTTVSASAIQAGKLVSGESHLGGSFDPYGELKCPEIHGYLPQMLEEAVDDLRDQVAEDKSLLTQANAASSYLQQVMRDRYNHKQS